MSDFQIQAYVFFKPVTQTNGVTFVRINKVRSSLKAAGYTVYWDLSDTRVNLTISGNNYKFKRVFGVDLIQTITVSAGRQTASYAEKSNPAIVLDSVRLPAGFGHEDTVETIVLSNIVSSAPLNHSALPPPPAPSYTARQGQHAPDVPYQIAAEPWFIYPYELRQHLNGPPGNPDTLDPDYQSSSETIINIVDSGVDTSHPYFLSRWGDNRYNNIRLINAYSVDRRDPDRLSRKLLIELENLRGMIGYASSKTDPSLTSLIFYPRTKLTEKLTNIRYQASMIDDWVGKLDTASRKVQTADATQFYKERNNLHWTLGGVIHWLKEALAEYARRRPSDLLPDPSGHGTEMVACAKSVANKATVVMWQNGVGVAAAGMPTRALFQRKLQRGKPIDALTATPVNLAGKAHRKKRSRQILSCSWGESVNPEYQGTFSSMGDNMLRHWADSTVRKATSKGYLVIFAAGNADTPAAPRDSCFAETGPLGTLVVGGAWWNQGTTLTLSDGCHGLTEQKYQDDVANSYQLDQPIPNVLGLCGPKSLALSNNTVKHAPAYVMRPSSALKATSKDYWEAKDSSNKSLGVWSLFYGGSSAATAQVAGAAAVFWDLFPDLSAEDVKRYMIENTTPCAAGESYQGVQYHDLTDKSSGKPVGLVNIAASIRHKRQDDALKKNVPMLLDILVPDP